jgi:hypothetical protein
MDDGRTWWRHAALVGWNYRPMARSDGKLVPLELNDPQARRRWLCDLVDRLPALLGDFGSLTEVRVNALGKGEGACMIDWRNREGPPTLAAFLQRETIETVETHLNLTCLDRDLKPLEIEHGADLWIKIRLTESGALDHWTDAPVYLRLELNADIYAPQSLGEVRDNALLAALNGPRLTNFLERIESDVPAQLLEMDGERYGGLVGPRGFTAPANALKDA